MGKARRRRGGVPWGVLVSAVLIVVAGVAGLLFLAVSSDTLRERGDAEAERFRLAFWQTPIPLQGPAPDTHAEPTRGIRPENCALCHYRQYQDWQDSRHAKAMGPGVAGQFPTLGAAEQAECRNCHAPLGEQWTRLPATDGGWLPNPAFDPALQSGGLVCAACHLRGHRRFGPLPGPSRIASGGVRASALLHGEPMRTEHFSAAEFCSGCHQHAAGTLRINGKTVENTYQEWLASPYPGQGKTCQTCHMPERRHLWRGIHDPETTRAGVTVTAAVEPSRPAPGDALEARLTLANTGTGHAFPTYTTPAVFLKAAFLDADGQVLAGGFYQERILQRRLEMETSPWGERFDTRLLPGESTTLTFARRVPPDAASLYLWVWVEPDHFYTGFYRGSLAGGRDFPGAALLERALRDSLESQYLLFSRTIPLGGRP